MSKQFLVYQAFIRSVLNGEKSIIFAQNYVVLSKKAYEILINYHHQKLESIQYDEFSMNNWIKERFFDD